MTDRFKRALSMASAPEDLKSRTLEAIGEKRKAPRRRMLRAGALAAACAAAIMGVAGLHISMLETAYVSLDVNPSIALAINSYGRVIDASAYGEDSQEVLSSVDVKSLPYEDAVRAILDSASMQPYLQANEELWIAVQADNPDMETRMESSVQAVAASAMEVAHPDVSVSASTVTQEVRTTSESEGMTATKYIAICELQELDQAATMDEYRESSIGEIHEHIDSCVERAETGHNWHAPPAQPQQTATGSPATVAPQTQAPATQVPAQQGGHHGYGHHGGRH